MTVASFPIFAVSAVVVTQGIIPASWGEHRGVRTLRSYFQAGLVVVLIAALSALTVWLTVFCQTPLPGSIGD